VPTEQAGPVPDNFQPSSITFVSQNLAWVIGQAGTPGKCADKNPYYCTSIVRTDNAGQSWEGGPAPTIGPPSGASGVTGIRFYDGVSGWAYGPELFSTHDAGKTWTHVDTGGMRVTDLETINHWAYALFARCKPTPGVGQFNYGCYSYTLMATPTGTDNWAPVGSATTSMTDGGDPTSGQISVMDAAGYLLAPDGTVFSGPIGGAWQKVGTAPCKPGPGQPSGQPIEGQFNMIDPTRLVVACTGWPDIPTQVYTSSDGGAHWTKAPAPPATIVTSLTSAAPGTIVMATENGIEVLPAGSTKWLAGKGSPPGGFFYVGMTTASQGVALSYDTTSHEIWMTFDGGLTWAPRTTIAATKPAS
jgi:hypothetical protein